MSLDWFIDRKYSFVDASRFLCFELVKSQNVHFSHISFLNKQKVIIKYLYEVCRRTELLICKTLRDCLLLELDKKKKKIVVAVCRHYYDKYLI